MPNEIPTKSRELVLARQLGRCFGCGAKLVINGGQWAHRRGRGVLDEHTMCPCNGLYLCATDHEWATRHPLEAKMRGWNLSRWVEDPSEHPALMWTGDRMVLDCEGGMKIENIDTEGATR